MKKKIFRNKLLKSNKNERLIDANELIENLNKLDSLVGIYNKTIIISVINNQETKKM